MDKVKCTRAAGCWLVFSSAHENLPANVQSSETFDQMSSGMLYGVWEDHVPPLDEILHVKDVAAGGLKA